LGTTDENETYNIVNEAWKKTCRIVLGGEIGDLAEYRNYLTFGGIKPFIQKKSVISGKPINIVKMGVWCKGAKFINNDEKEKYNNIMKNLKIDINKIKDIDSLVETVADHFYYTGGLYHGNTNHLVRSDKITNSFYIYESVFINDCKYMAFCVNMRESEHMFNWLGSSENKFGISGFETMQAIRCFEVGFIIKSSDCFYSANLEGCSDCMFSFNQRNKHYMIGNNQLSREKYKQIKEKLIGEVRETLRTKKSVLRLTDLLKGE